MIDLHVHSTVSDGSYSPSGLARLAKETGVEAFALTDHDSIAGDAEAAAEADRLGVGFINGMEMTMAYRGRKIHVVCLGFNPENDAFQKLYSRLRYIKEESMVDVVDVLRRRGIEIDMEMVKRHASVHLDRYAIMRTIVDLNVFDGIQYIWDNYLNPAVKEVGVAGDIPAEEALPAIRQAGGVTSLAHFHKLIGLKGQSRAEQEESIRELIGFGLTGMEQYYPNYTDEDRAFASAMIEKYSMLPTGGTDFHGANRPGILLGTGFEKNMNTPLKFLEDIRESCRR
ncbi:PHP domain-containing protein [Anaerovibrio sp.]|uniref:PHP domain-containing protein n=1 Tax=Anaerovibrio sp. TaxID=1872532 RepID=UPI003F17CB50